MLQDERHAQILAKLALAQRVTVKDLAKEFEVTEDCIRKDLSLLQKAGKLKRVHGGAIACRQNFHVMRARDRSHTSTEEKKAMAKACLDLIEPGMMVFLGVSSTCVELARLIYEKRMHVTVVTNMTAIMDIFLHDERDTLLFIGGQPNKGRDGFVGSLAIAQIRQFRFDVAVMGAVGIDLEEGRVMTYNVEDGVTKQAVLDSTRKAVLVAESAKFSQDGHYTFANVDEFDLLVTGYGPALEELDGQPDIILVDSAL